MWRDVRKKKASVVVRYYSVRAHRLATTTPTSRGKAAARCNRFVRLRTALT